MEELFVYALLYAEGFDVWTSYSDTLDKLFTQNPENEEYLALEEMTPKDAVLHSISLVNQGEFNAEFFGKLLMQALRPIYEKTIIEVFVGRMYSLWRKLPLHIGKEEPFLTLCYAGDCLSYGDADQCRQLYEEAMSFYG